MFGLSTRQGERKHNFDIKRKTNIILNEVSQFANQSVLEAPLRLTYNNTNSKVVLNIVHSCPTFITRHPGTEGQGKLLSEEVLLSR